jgi:hypothetical protein
VLCCAVLCCVVLCCVVLCAQRHDLLHSSLLYSTLLYSLATSLQADGNWETLEYGKAAVSGEYIVEEEPDEDRPGGVTR